MSLKALQDMSQYLIDGGQVGIFDATNTTRDRRQMNIDTYVGY